MLLPITCGFGSIVRCYSFSHAEFWRLNKWLRRVALLQYRFCCCCSVDAHRCWQLPQCLWRPATSFLAYWSHPLVIHARAPMHGYLYICTWITYACHKQFGNDVAGFRGNHILFFALFKCTFFGELCFWMITTGGLLSRLWEYKSNVSTHQLPINYWTRLFRRCAV